MREDDETIEGAAKAYDAAQADACHKYRSDGHLAGIRAARAYAPLPGGAVTDDEAESALVVFGCPSWTQTTHTIKSMRCALEAFVARRNGKEGA